ncbi:hypothetical protein LXL04_022122 [Taraxacum kok-saghyz]
MQSRRHEDYPSESSYGRGRRNTDHVPDGYLMRSPPHSKRSWSPRPERLLTHHRGASMERRRLVDDGSRRIRSRSPPIMEVKRVRPFYNDDWVVDRDQPTSERHSRYEFMDRMDMKHADVDSHSPTRNNFSYGPGSSRTALTENKYEGRRLDTGMGEIMSRKSPFTGLYRSREPGPTSRSETSKNISSTLNIGLELEHPDKERFSYQDSRGPFTFDKYSSDKYSSMKQYDDGDKVKHMVLLRDPPYSNLPPSRSKESISASHLKDYARTSPQKSRMDHLSYRSDIPLSRDNNHPLNSSNTSHPLSPSRYAQRQHLDHGRDPYLEYNEDTGRYHRDTFSPSRTGHLDSIHLQPRLQDRDDYMYPSDDIIYEKMDIRERVDYRDREILKPNLLPEASDFGHRGRTSFDYLSSEKVPLQAEKREHSQHTQHTQYLDPDSVHMRIGRKISREEEIPYMGLGQERVVRVDYDYKQDLGTESYRERRRDSRSHSPRFLYEMERRRDSPRLNERTHRMEERHDLSPYDSSSRMFQNRKYTMIDDENRIVSSRRHNQDFSDEEWIDQETRGSNYTKRRDHDHDHDYDHHHHSHGFSRRVDKVYDETDEYMHDHIHHMKPYKYEDNNNNKYPKGYSRSGGYNNNSYHQNKKQVFLSRKNVSRRSENDNDMYSNEVEELEDLSNFAKSEPREDTQEFKKRLHEFFLSFTKKLNENSSVRRRYMEQGRAGSLFCIVCGRSLSKEFMDTERLAMHAFMSRKVGLRAQHLALHKALCYMLGWNGVLPSNTIRWFPEPLSSSESLAQKEDLIIWPPVVVVHNVSIINNDSNGKGPTTLEELGQFLRGKGLSGGKVKLGKYANCSIMLVKFLGTFSALQEAEKIHDYFLKNKHGRKYLDYLTSGKGKSKDGEDEKDEKEGERVLFGYMGIAQDLDKVDFDTKRKCSIKSKKEIKDIADAPVKAE